MKAIFFGGTGLISCASSQLAIEKGWDLTLVNRGNRPEFTPKDAEVFNCDLNDEDRLRSFLSGKSYDVAVEWVAFHPERVHGDVNLLLGKTRQYILISSCAAYERPMKRHLVTEDLPLNNKFWQYGRDKRMCEEEAMTAYRELGFPVTIVRPSLTYGDSQIPYAMGCWAKPWSLVQRMLDGKPIICHGDGVSLWSVTHNSDFAKGFVGLMGKSQAVGEAYHIVSDEVLTWDQIAEEIAEAAGTQAKIVHMSAHQISRFIPHMLGSLLGDKSTSAIFDCSKIKRLVPEFICTTPFSAGIRKTISYFRSHPELQIVDEEWNASIDALIEADSRVCPVKS
ncbi:MAG: NAD-dependent epimerase/dehydratase family protein [Clostridiales bacterium]|jgi:nucleoside-diphosphate-sugar epimerase|nr:NAD-dependent epimerase/dehydratase family protein [Clostridiales bacterium]